MKQVSSQVQAGFFRRKEAARFLNISERHLATLVSLRKIPCIRLGHRCVLFDPIRIHEALARFEEREIGGQL
jgi:hypothetical protein